MFIEIDGIIVKREYIAAIDRNGNEFSLIFLVNRLEPLRGAINEADNYEILKKLNDYDDDDETDSELEDL
jgi:sRNA-binding regulator protein Hfq